MKSPKEKAEELVSKFSNEVWRGDMVSRISIDCAIIVCDEILKLKLIDVTDRGFGSQIFEGDYWRQVKGELLNMMK